MYFVQQLLDNWLILVLECWHTKGDRNCFILSCVQKKLFWQIMSTCDNDLMSWLVGCKTLLAIPHTPRPALQLAELLITAQLTHWRLHWDFHENCWIF